MGSGVYIVAGLLLVCAACAGQEGVNRYRFETDSDYLARATDFGTWAEMLARHEGQRAALYECDEPGQPQCRGRLHSFKRIMARAPELTAAEQVQLVNLYINRSRYDDDRPERLFDEDGHKTGVRRNHWNTLYEFLTQRGDCEDYATAKYFMLRELGFASDDLRVVVTYERRLRGYHAVLAVRMDDQVWLLESDNLIKKNYHAGYRYVYAMNEDSVWDHRADYARPAQAGSG